MTEPAGRLADRRIALGITGSIAAYKAVELLRLLQVERDLAVSFPESTHLARKAF